MNLILTTSVIPGESLFTKYYGNILPQWFTLPTFNEETNFMFVFRGWYHEWKCDALQENNIDSIRQEAVKSVKVVQKVSKKEKRLANWRCIVSKKAFCF